MHSCLHNLQSEHSQKCYGDWPSTIHVAGTPGASTQKLICVPLISPKIEGKFVHAESSAIIHVGKLLSYFAWPVPVTLLRVNGNYILM